MSRDSYESIRAERERLNRECGKDKDWPARVFGSGVAPPPEGAPYLGPLYQPTADLAALRAENDWLKARLEGCERALLEAHAEAARLREPKRAAEAPIFPLGHQHQRIGRPLP